ncbi:hypothetical protein [Pseudomonas syringae]|uniref:hypothetical protein n=1 Tax=Pseudomonas syringae TaxID=317 RepID=UPI0011C3AF2F|nr:hypothetical protein [Pseudomonas syringae]MDP5165525.1 hypothetical protein [Pseudomonas syringae pv. aptata str. DSM 50252]
MNTPPIGWNNMRRKKKPELSFIEWGGKVVGAVGVLAFAAYIAGHAKFYFLYKALNCQWVLSFHSVQDVVANGAMDVVLCSITAVPLFYIYKNSIDVDNNGRRIVGFTIVGMTISVGVAVLVFGYKLDAYVADLMIYLCSYFFYGVAIAHSARYSLEEGNYHSLLICFLGFVFSTFFSSYLVYEYKTFSLIYERGGFPYLVVGLDGKSEVLIGAVNGKYLARICGEADKYQLIVPTNKWLVEMRDPASCRGA